MAECEPAKWRNTRLEKNFKITKNTFFCCLKELFFFFFNGLNVFFAVVSTFLFGNLLDLFRLLRQDWPEDGPKTLSPGRKRGHISKNHDKDLNHRMRWCLRAIRTVQSQKRNYTRDGISPIIRLLNLSPKNQPVESGFFFSILDQSTRLIAIRYEMSGRLLAYTQKSFVVDRQRDECCG